MIEIKNLYKTYSTKKVQHVAINGINLSIQKGQIFGIIGRSGAGKSTLVRCINLLERPTDGSVIIDGKDLVNLSKNDLNEERQNIGMIFQHFNLLDSRNVFRNIAFPLEIQGKSKEEIKKRVDELLALTGLTSFAKKYPNELSGGQKQRVAIARAISSNPKVLLSDEATSALDPETTQQILKLLKDINQKLGITIIVITHEMEVVRDICDEVAILDQGKVAEQGNVIDIFLKPKSAVGKTLAEKTMKVELPDYMLDKLYKNAYTEKGLTPIIKVTFLGKETKEPIISTLLRKFDIEINTLQANIEQILGQTVGIYICQIIGDKPQWELALEYLHEHNFQFEVIGYAKHDAF